MDRDHEVEAEGEMPATRRSRIAPSELLIVSLVVGILALMLFPVFVRARDRARQAVCFGNVRTIVRAVLMYVADHDGYLPPQEENPEAKAYFSGHPGGGGKEQWDPGKPGRGYCPRVDGANPHLRWPVILDTYLPSREVWRCPNARLEGGASFINGAGSQWLEHLRTHEGEWGRETQEWLCPIPSWPAGWGGEVTDSIKQRRLAVPRGGRGREASPGTFVQSIGVNTQASGPDGRYVAAVEAPAWFVISADCGSNVGEFSTGLLAYPDVCGLECGGPGGRQVDGEACPWSRECGATPEMLTDPAVRQRYARHQGGVNIGFLDGHVRWFHSEQVIALSPSQGDPNRGRLRGYGPWGPTRDQPGLDPATPTLY